MTEVSCAEDLDMTRFATGKLESTRRERNEHGAPVGLRGSSSVVSVDTDGIGTKTHLLVMFHEAEGV